MRVAFLGLGIMGRPMASNLVKAGHEVAVWSRTAGKGCRRRTQRDFARRCGTGRGSRVDVRFRHQCGRKRFVRAAGGRGVAGRRHDHRGFQHDFAFGDPQVRRAGWGPGSALRRCADDGIESGGGSRNPYFHRGWGGSGDRVAEAAVCRHGQSIFPHRRNRHGTIRQAGHESADCADL